MANNYEGQDGGYYQAEKERPRKAWTVDESERDILGWSIDWEEDYVWRGNCDTYKSYNLILDFFREQQLVFPSPRDALEYLEGK